MMPAESGQCMGGCVCVCVCVCVFEFERLREERTEFGSDLSTASRSVVKKITLECVYSSRLCC